MARTFILAGWLALLVGLWLGYGMPPRGWWFYGALVWPALIVGVVSWHSAWLGQRSQFGHSSAPRAEYVDGGQAGPAFAYFKGTWDASTKQTLHAEKLVSCAQIPGGMWSA